MNQFSDALQNLLDLHDCILDQENGYWIKIEAWQVMPSIAIPHGIRYCLTLHEPYGKRILGYDNAHAIKPSVQRKFTGKRYQYDHKHSDHSDRGTPYEFTDPHQLLTDFFTDVDRVLRELASK